ncbi:MAG TPA: hypothetical protein VF587_03320, partial [Solirubrobacteraceae bacterium]
MRRAAAALAVIAALAAPGTAAADLLVSDGDNPRAGLSLVSDDGATRTPILRRDDTAFGRPAWSPDGRRYAVSSAERFGSKFGPLLVGEPGAEPQPLPGGDGLSSPAWSPDGTTIGAVRFPYRRGADAPRVVELVLLSAQGGEPRVLTTGAYDTEPAWSPDGGEVAFTRGTAIHAVRPDGTGLRKVVDDAFGAAWSPDGSRIAFATTRDRNGRTCFGESCSVNPEIYVANADG